jgi:hypothetical protein
VSVETSPWTRPSFLVGPAENCAWIPLRVWFRVHPGVTPVPPDGALRLVGVRPAHWLARAFAVPHDRLPPLTPHQIAWPLIANYSCQATAKVCARADNQGWRYFLYAMGGLMLICWAIRFLAFPLHESPKFLVGRGRDAEAVETVHRVAAYNGVPVHLTLEQLEAVDREFGRERAIDTSAQAAARRTLQLFEMGRVRTLFATRKMAWTTSLLIVIWGMRMFVISSSTQTLTETFSADRTCVPLVQLVCHVFVSEARSRHLPLLTERLQSVLARRGLRRRIPVHHLPQRAHACPSVWS